MNGYLLKRRPLILQGAGLLYALEPTALVEGKLVTLPERVVAHPAGLAEQATQLLSHMRRPAQPTDETKRGDSNIPAYRQMGGAV